MTEISNREALLERLVCVVDAYGAEELRWPPEDQRQLAALVAGDDRARQIMRDGQALDQILAQADLAAGEAPAGNAGLANRVMALVEEDGVRTAAQPLQQSAEIVTLPVGRTPRAASVGVGAPALSPAGWLSAAALAASLLLGVFVGASGYLEAATSSVSEIAGLASSSQTLQIGDGFGPIDEDYL